MTILLNRIQQLSLSALLIGSILSPLPAMAEHNADHGSMKQGQQCQKGGEWGKKHKEAHEKFMQELNLTDAQKEQMKAAHEKFRKENSGAMDSLKAKYSQMKALGKDSANEAERQKIKAEIKQERQALMAKKKASMQGILTPEQQSKWEAKQAERKAQWEKKKAAHKSDAPKQY